MSISMTQVSKRIGIMGGTFDPIHYGHLMLAEQIRTSFYLDEIVFIPVGKPSHKSNDVGASKQERLKMTKLAIKDNPYFSVSDIEINRDKLTYTIDTIEQFKKGMFKNDDLFFITGADAILYLDKWKDFDKLIKEVTFIGASRPSIDKKALDSKIEALRNMGTKVEISYVPALEISSTDIKNRIQNNKSIKYLLPESVEGFIEKKGLYQTHHESYSRLKKIVKSKLSSYRFEHSMATAKMSRVLAGIHGLSMEKAELAGLCHDYMKEIDNHSAFEYIEEYGIEKDPALLSNPNLAHGEIAAAVLRREGLIEDEEILDAIRWHTYGHAYMSDLSKVVFLADVIEPSRKFDGIETIRHLAMENLNKAVLNYLDQSEAYLNLTKKPIHKNADRMKENLSGKEDI